jgi:hypothetical protein
MRNTGPESSKTSKNRLDLSPGVWMRAGYGPAEADFVGLAAPDLCNLLDFFPPFVYNIIVSARYFAPSQFWPSLLGEAMMCFG